MSDQFSKVSFPGLGIGEFVLDRVAFTVFGREIVWYALIITTGIIFCFFYTNWRAKSLGLVFDDVVDIGAVAVLAGIIGARVYYVLTTLENYQTFWQMLAIWEGGLAIYGALIGGGIAVYVMCRKKRVPFLAFGDCTIPAILFAQMAGRWGNFVNGEAFGGQTDLFCRMGLQNRLTFLTFGTTEMVYVHPTFLYESLWNLVGFLLANHLFKRRKYNGFIVYFCFAWYGFGRMFIENLRTDSLYIPFTELRISVVVGAAFFVLCSILMLYSHYKLKNGTEEQIAAMKPINMTPAQRQKMLAKGKKK
ncbi:MAG: prolipoprotein diacylglyceryl transferase [Eubacteriales bacterium]